MAAHYRSAFPAFLLIVLCGVTSCGPLEPRVETLEIRAHSLDASPSCRIDSNPDITLQALGSFPVSSLGTERLSLHARDQMLAFPADTRGVEAVATDFADDTWHGYTDRRTGNGIDVLLWRKGVACELYQGAEGSTYPGSNGGQAIGYSPEAGVLLVAGSDSMNNAAGGALVFDAGTGRSNLVESSFPDARAYATVTSFGSGLLLAGGENPLETDLLAEREILRSAAVYDAAVGGFDGDVLELELRRTRHAAVVTAEGETLLVGGVRTRSDGSLEPVTQFEKVSPKTRRSTVNGVVGLANGRIQPTALLLDNGNILVGGGYDVSGAPVSSLEWFSPTADCALSPRENACTSEPPSVRLGTPRHHRAFVAMPGGGVLTVGGCEPAAVQTPECETACGVGFGCPAQTTNANWITPDAENWPVSFEPSEECGSFSPERVQLAPGSDGSPWLLAYDLDVEPPCRAVYRFNPWRNRFEPGRIDPSPWPDPRTPLTSLGPDAFACLTEDDPPLLAGTRAGVRGPLSQYETSLLYAPSDQLDQLRPVHLAPDRPKDRPPNPDTRLARAQAIFTPGWRLILEIPKGDEQVVTVYVTDTRYDDVSVKLEFSTAGPPVLLFDSYEIGGRDCAWPEDADSPLIVVRRGTRVTSTDGNGASVTCNDAPSGSIGIATRAGATSPTLSSFVVRRL